jgi:hypothetical protein
MESPRLSGYRKDNRAYEVTAIAAMQDVRRPTVIELRDMKARLTLDESGTVARCRPTPACSTPERASRDAPERSGAHRQRQEADLRSASVDLKGGTVTSTSPSSCACRTRPSRRRPQHPRQRQDHHLHRQCENRHQSRRLRGRGERLGRPAQAGVARTSQAAPLSLRP